MMADPFGLFANSEDLDEMAHNDPSHDLHGLPFCF